MHNQLIALFLNCERPASAKGLSGTKRSIDSKCQLISSMPLFTPCGSMLAFDSRALSTQCSQLHRQLVKRIGSQGYQTRNMLDREPWAANVGSVSWSTGSKARALNCKLESWKACNRSSIMGVVSKGGGGWRLASYQ